MKNKFDYYLLNFLTVILFSFAGCSVANSNETKNTAPTFHVQTQNPDAKPTRVIPEYVTAWPKKVAVEKPDPVLGDKLVWEHWIYGEEFAKRFEGFPIEKADKELFNSPIKAVVLRIYKTNMWIGVNPNFPEQYATDIDLYFDSNIKIPLTDKERTPIKADDFPKGILPSFKQLTPFNLVDKIALQNVKETFLYPERPYRILVTPFDSRLSSLGGNYYPHFLEGVSHLRLTARVLGGVAVPLQNNGSLWLSIFGRTPYYDNSNPLSKRVFRESYKETNATFEPGEHPENQGYVKLPHSFYEVALPKMALIKDLNYCISQRHSYEKNTNKQPSKKRDEFFKWCEDAETNGLIFHPSDYLSIHPKHDGLDEIGF